MKTLEALDCRKREEMQKMEHRVRSTPIGRIRSERIVRSFSRSALRILMGKGIEGSSDTANGLLRYVASLREFNSYEETCRRAIVEDLFTALIIEYPRNDAGWENFFHSHWHLIWAFAKDYGKDRNWLAQANYYKVTVLAFGKQYQCLWWWRLVLGRRFRVLRRFIMARVQTCFAAERKREGDRPVSWFKGIYSLAPS